MSKAAFVYVALIAGVAAAAAATEPTRLGPGQPFFVAGAPVGVAFARGGGTLVALGDGRLRAWDVATARVSFDVAVAGARAGVVAADGERVAVVAGSNVELRRAADGSIERTLPMASAPSSLAFADATTLAAADAGGAIVLVDVLSGARRALAPASGGLRCFAAGGGVVVACGDRGLRRWNVRGEPMPALAVADANAAAVAAGHVAVAHGNRVQVSTSDGRVERSVDVSDAPWAVALSPDGRRLALPRGDGVDVVDVATGRRLHEERPGAAVREVAFSTDGTRVVARDGDGKLRAWKRADGSTVAGEPLPAVRCSAPHGAPWQMARDCKSGVLVDEAGKRVRVWRATGGETSLPLPPRSTAAAAFGDDVVALALAPVEPPIDPATGHAREHAEIVVLAGRSVRWRRTVAGHLGAIAVRRDGARVAVAVDDQVLVVSDASGEPVRLSQPAAARALAFSPAGDTLAAGLADGSVAVSLVR